MRCYIALIDPNTNKVVKGITITAIYREAEERVNSLNNKLNAKGNKKELFWKVLTVNV